MKCKTQVKYNKKQKIESLFGIPHAKLSTQSQAHSDKDKTQDDKHEFKDDNL